MESKIVNLKLQNKVPWGEIRKGAKVIDRTADTPTQERKWAGLLAKLNDNIWTKRCTEYN